MNSPLGSPPMPLFSPAWIKWAASVPVAATQKDPEHRSQYAEDDCFSSLPYDLVMKLFVNYLHPCDLVNIMCLNYSSYKRFQDENMWKSLCARQLKCKARKVDVPYRYKHCESVGACSSSVKKRELSTMDSFEVIQMSPMSYRDLYTKLLFPFRGLFNRVLRASSESTPWGLILTVEYRDGIVYGRQWMLPEDAANHMIPVADFSVYVDGATDRVEIVNHLVRSRICRDVTQLRLMIFTDQFTMSEHQKPLCFQFRRGIGESYTGWNAELDDEFASCRKSCGWSWPEDQFFVPERGFYKTKMKWMDLLRHDLSYHRFYPDSLGLQPSNLQGVGVIYGYFKANLKGRGTQLFKVFSPTRGDSVDGVKVTGDSARSCEMVAFWFSFRNGIIVPPDQLQAVHQPPESKWKQLKSKTRSITGAVKQEFKLPVEMHPHIAFDLFKVPKYCLGRFTGKWHPYDLNQRAALQPESTKPTNAQLVVFSASSFLILWYHPSPGAILFEKIQSDDPFFSFVQ
ncbi:uncharacterized protein LOC129583767 [Paramacrobiotus metropolitanus]|uniref:uncharacterized protein LOC129583767 n=1 Tax=Paramacrobiotus metropolitanus TaxID=2943436 RepID=UPI0024462667|nr:uncharacterized protein LOC129583767 [Paramacrobiotus metropolitanus]